jgi:hypothetical protein
VLIDLPPFTDAATNAGDRGVARSRPEPEPRHTVIIPQPKLLVSAAGAGWKVDRKRGSAIGAIAPSPDTLFEPVDGYPALRWKGSASPETTITAEKRIPLGIAIPGTRVA